MVELPVFVSYRQSDGASLARWLRRHLHGRTFAVGGPECTTVTASVYVDQCVPAEADWAAFLDAELDRAAVLIVLCTPEGSTERHDYDWFYHELRWWTANRNESPILIRDEDLHPIGAPAPIRDAWPRAEIVRAKVNSSTESEDTIQRIIGGIRLRIRRMPKGPEVPPAYDAAGLFTWEKDKHFRYIRCNENYAAAAGLDSPNSIIGKTDDDMPWRELAESFRKGDYGVMTGIGPPRFHVQEKEIMVDRSADILVTESQLLDKRGDCVGVSGYFIDITGRILVGNPQSRSSLGDDIALGGELKGQFLSPEEAGVVIDFLRSSKGGNLADRRLVNAPEFRHRLAAVKSKLNCRSHGDLVAALMRSGVPLQVLAPSTRERTPKPESE